MGILKGDGIFEYFRYGRKRSPWNLGGVEFYHTWTNSVLQQAERICFIIADALFRISSMTDLFKYKPLTVPTILVTDPGETW